MSQEQEVINRIRERIEQVMDEAEDEKSFVDLLEHKDIEWQADTVAKIRGKTMEFTIRTPSYRMDVEIQEK